MQRSQFLLFIFLLVAFSACKKDLLQWQKVQQLNSNTTARLNNIHFVSDNVCVIGGGIQWQQSDVLKSTDGGYTWTDNSYPAATAEMIGMGVSTNGEIYLSGVYGNILHSKDSGATWQYSRINDYLNDVGGTFATPDTGIFVSSVLQRQCGITRVDSNFNILDEQTYQFGLNNIYMISSSVGYVIGYGTVMITKNRGNTWNFQNVEGDNFEAMDIHGEEIWMCGYMGSVFHTADGGNNWQRLRNGNDITLPRYNLLNILFKDSLHGWAVCDNGKVIFTDDGGNHWEEYNQFTTTALRSIALCPNGDLLVAGDYGTLYRISP